MSTAAESRRGPPPERLTIGGLLARFLLAGLIALTTTIALTAWASRQSGIDQAKRDAQETTWLIGVGVIQPALTAGTIAGDRAALEDLHRLVIRSVINASLLRVKLWDGDGTILYSDEPRLIGQRFALGEDELKILNQGGTDAEMSDLRAPENMFETSGVAQLEVYTRILGPANEPLLFEAYFENATVQQAARRAWARGAPISIGALILLQLAQIPVVWQLAKRMRREQAEREKLLRQAIDASANERRRIAADLHDGVVQDLSGVAFSLSAVGRSPGLPEPVQVSLGTAADQIRTSVRGMRSLLVDLYPPNLADEGLETALESLLARLSAQGVLTTLDVSLPDGSVDQECFALLYRSAQEALRNVTKHAQAHAVAMSVRRAGDRAVLTVEDDGVGFDPTCLLTARHDGHVGMRVLGDLVAECGGDVYVESSTGRGTKVTVEVPA